MSLASASVLKDIFFSEDSKKCKTSSITLQAIAQYLSMSKVR